MQSVITNTQMDITNTYRTSHPTAAEYAFLSSVHETFIRIDHMTQQIKEDINYMKYLFQP